MDSHKYFLINQMSEHDDYDDDFPSSNSCGYEFSEFYDDFGDQRYSAYGDYSENQESSKDKHIREREKDGEFCVKCKEFYPFAEPNQPNNKMICYSCNLFNKLSK